jgi:tRNA threonylcarbamoyladenosine biosynthesis protein TsaB
MPFDYKKVSGNKCNILCILQQIDKIRVFILNADGMGTILLIETSTEVCSVALAGEGGVFDVEENLEGLSHAELLTSFIETILKRNSLPPGKIDAVAVSKGPGSYTGLRIGVSVAKGLCYALEKPLVAVCTLDALASHVSHNLNDFGILPEPGILFCPMVDARRMEVFFAVYNNNSDYIEPVSAKIISEDSFSGLFETHRVLFFGNGAAKCSNILKHQNAVFAGPQKVSARFMANIAWQKFLGGEFEDVAYFEPFYLKDFVATVPKNKVF